MEETKNFFASKINWAQIVSMVAMLAAFFGFDLPADVQAELVAFITVAVNLATMIFRTWFTNKKIA